MCSLCKLSPPMAGMQASSGIDRAGSERRVQQGGPTGDPSESCHCQAPETVLPHEPAAIREFDSGHNLITQKHIYNEQNLNLRISRNLNPRESVTGFA